MVMMVEAEWFVYNVIGIPRR